MDVGEGREPGAEALPAKCALQLNASGLAETLLYYSEVPYFQNIQARNYYQAEIYEGSLWSQSEISEETLCCRC